MRTNDTMIKTRSVLTFQMTQQIAAQTDHIKLLSKLQGIIKGRTQAKYFDKDT
jgi:hypothetical protein